MASLRDLVETMRNFRGAFVPTNSALDNTYTSETFKIVLKDESPEQIKEKQRKVLSRRIKRFISRLQTFLDTGTWKIKKEIKITGADKDLQKLLTTFSKEVFEIEANCHAVYTIKELQKNGQYLTLKKIFKEAGNKVQEELKFRERRKEKRRMLFLLDS